MPLVTRTAKKKTAILAIGPIVVGRPYYLGTSPTDERIRNTHNGVFNAQNDTYNIRKRSRPARLQTGRSENAPFTAAWGH